MELTSNDRLIWVGKKIDSHLIDKGLAEGSVVKLNTTFRVPSKVMTHIRNNHVIPISDLPKSNDVQGMDVVRTKITLNGPNQVESLSKDILAEKLCEILLMKGIHPGQCAILYTEDVKDQLFPVSEGGTAKFVELLNLEMKSKMKNPRYAPQVTDNMDESVFYSHGTAVLPQNTSLLADTNTNPEDTVQYHHDTHPEVLYCTLLYCTVLYYTVLYRVEL